MTNKTIFITVTSGRSGTGFLQQIMSTFEDFTSEHEASPVFSGPMFQQNQYDYSIGKTLWKRKLSYIDSLATNNYIDTSHLICKGFIEPLLDLDILPNVIFLTRNLREVATSLFRINSIPGTDSNYLISPHSPISLLPVTNWNKFTDYQKCYWYAYEHELRHRYYLEILNQKGCITHTISLPELKIEENVRQMESKFNISLNTIKYTTIKNEVINAKLHKKRKLPNNIEELEYNARQHFIL